MTDLFAHSPELVPDLAALMPPSGPLLERLVDEYAPIAAALSTPAAHWIGFNGWMTDRLSGQVVGDGVSAQDIGEYAWAIHASSYWGALELRENWGMPPAMANMGMDIPEPPFADVQLGLIVQMSERVQAIREGADACLALLPKLVREAVPTAPIHGCGYNAGVQVVKTEDPPIGQRRPHRPRKPGAVRINGRDFLRVDYDRPVPEYLKVWRSEFERAVATDPERYEAVLAGTDDEVDLREIWATSVAFGNTTWGGDAQDVWTLEYWEESIRWSSVLNFGLEAGALAAITALVSEDASTAELAVKLNTIYQGSSMGWLIGFLDVDAEMPTPTPA